jgi:phosphoadenosine phosphosulfate reductase
MVQEAAALGTEELEDLNRKHRPLRYEQRIEEVYKDFDKVLLTSSFGTSSAILLYYLSKVHPGATVHFIDTGFHFPETLEYKDRLAEHFGLNVEPIRPHPGQHEVTEKERMWEKDPDLCCQINKVQPVQNLLPEYDVWVSGLMAYTNMNRRHLNYFVQRKDKLRHYPLLDISREEVETLFQVKQFPQHPLVNEGYGSIGCSHCTFKGKGRNGRWPGRNKMECGLHFS